MALYAREVVTLDRVSAASQRFGTSQPLPMGSNIPHEDGLLCWINAACAALNKAEVSGVGNKQIVVWGRYNSLDRRLPYLIFYLYLEFV